MPPDNATGRPPGGVSTLEIAHDGGDTKSITARAGTCWRCGVPFAWTDLPALRRCTELARSAGQHRRTLRFEDIPRENW